MRPLRADDPPQIGGYPLVGRLGSGAMGEVYLARSRSARPIAIKVVRRELADSPQFRQRFAREVAAMQTVGGFWTAAVLDADAHADQPWLASEYIAGPNLAEAVTAAPMPIHTCQALLAGLAEALWSIHRAGLIHRDLKPSNVILGPQGAKVIDFGIARLLTATDQTLTHTAIGTPAYMAPEQIRGDDLDPACDVWALAATIAFAAGGRGPSDGPTVEAVIHNVLTQPPDLNDVPAPIADMLAPCLNKQPQARPTPEQLLAQVANPPTAATAHEHAWHPSTRAPLPTPPADTRPIPEPRPDGVTVAYQPVAATRHEALPQTRLDDGPTVGPRRSPSLPQSPPPPAERPVPWRSVPVLLTTMLILQTTLAITVVARDFAATALISDGLLATDTADMAQVYLRQFHFGDGILFAIACASTTLTAITLIRAVYHKPGWRTLATTTASILLAGFAVNAVDLPTRLVTHVFFSEDFDQDPRLTLDQATAWYTVIAGDVTLLMLVGSVLVIIAARTNSAQR